MVLLATMQECSRGEHDKCAGVIQAPPGMFDGVICDCPCHNKSARHEPMAGYADDEVEVAFWAAIRDGDDPDDFQLYLSQFPAGRFTEIARRRIAEIRSGGAPPE